MDDRYANALQIWERGIQRAPMFPSNYLYAAKIFLPTSERGWGMLYGEIFLNIEPSTPRSTEIRTKLYEAWNDAVTTQAEGLPSKEGETAVKVDLFEKLVVELDTTTKLAVLPFQFYLVRSFAMAAAPSTADSDSILSIAQLHAMRKRFVRNWFSDSSV